MHIKKFLVIFGLFMSLVATDIASAQSGAESPGILPYTSLGVDACNVLMAEVDQSFGLSSGQNARVLAFEDRDGQFSFSSGGESFNATGTDILACGIKTGNISLWMIPFYIRFILEFVIGLAGIIAVGGVVYGGYLYLFAGVSDDKDRGKKAIMYGLGGFILTMLAFGIVNIVIALVSG